MEELKLRGYTTPEDFEGTDTEKCQKAIDVAEAEDIRKVLIEKEYTLTEALKVPTQIEILVTKTGALKGETVFVNKVATEPEKNSWSFEDKQIYLKGEEGAKIEGDMKFYHAQRTVIEDLAIKGQITFEFCREIRMERDVIETAKDAAVVLMRGCNNYIVQYNTFKAAKAGIVIDTTKEEGAYVIGKDIDDHELIFKDNKFDAETGFALEANENAGIFNVQIDHNEVTGNGIVIGSGKNIPEERFFNLTATDFTGAKEAVVKNNATKHCYFGE